MNSDFQQEYIEEAKQVLKNLEQSLLELEQKSTPEEINNVYRFLHTLKGSAGMFGFHDVEKLSHEVEALYSDVRDGLRQVDEFILEITFHAVDVLNDLIDGKDAKQQAEQIIQNISGVKGDSGNSLPSAPTQQNRAEAYVIFLKPEPGIYKRGINFSSILQDVQDLGTSEIFIYNESIPVEKQFQNKEVLSWFEIILCSNAGPDAVRDTFMFMKESEYTVLPVTSGDIFSNSVYREFVSLSGSETEHRTSLLKSFVPHLFADGKAGHNSAQPSVDIVIDEDEEESQDKIIRKSKKSGHVSVSTQKLDQLINIVSELVIFRSEMQHIMSDVNAPEIAEAMEKMERLSLRLRDSAFNLRLVPLNILNVKLQRLIRSVSKELGKEIDFITEGLDTESSIEV